jgi:hypothetical protein
MMVQEKFKLCANITAIQQFPDFFFFNSAEQKVFVSAYQVFHVGSFVFFIQN